MNKPTITLFSAILIAGSSTLFAQENQRGQGGDRERPDLFALSDKDENGSVSLDELVNARIEMMSRRGGRGRQGQGEGEGQQRDPAQMAARIKEQLGEAFKKADVDESGELSREEFAKLPQGRGQRGGPGGGQRGGPGGGPRGPRGNDA